MEPFVLKHHPIPHVTIKAWEEFIPNLTAGFSTREGGQSKNQFQSMSLALHVGDQEEDVINNRKILANAIHFPFEAWTSGEQIHSNHITIVTKQERGKGRLKREDAIQDTDGLITNQSDILLTSFYADCVPLFFLDPMKQVIGLAHAGWKGTVSKIAEQMVHTMKNEFQSEVDDIKVVIGPAIDQCCYEVNDMVIQPLRAAGIDHLPKETIMEKGNGHYDLDLKKINRQILKNAGILGKNIEISSYCTSCHTDIFYSHRKEKGNTGRMASWIGLRKGE